MKKPFKFKENKRTDPNGRWNGQRAEGAAFAVAAAFRARGEAGQVVSEDGIRDLLADLGHLCDREGLDFVKIVATATKDWRAER